MAPRSQTRGQLLPEAAEVSQMLKMQFSQTMAKSPKKIAKVTLTLKRLWTPKS